MLMETTSGFRSGQQLSSLLNLAVFRWSNRLTRHAKGLTFDGAFLQPD